MKRFLAVLILSMLLAACLPIPAECNWSDGNYHIDWQPKKGSLAINFEVNDLECE